MFDVGQDLSSKIRCRIHDSAPVDDEEQPARETRVAFPKLLVEGDQSNRNDTRLPQSRWNRRSTRKPVADEILAIRRLPRKG